VGPGGGVGSSGGSRWLRIQVEAARAAPADAGPTDRGGEGGGSADQAEKAAAQRIQGRGGLASAGAGALPS